jgi:hypothetical protein
MLRRVRNNQVMAYKKADASTPKNQHAKSTPWQAGALGREGFGIS